MGRENSDSKKTKEKGRQDYEREFRNVVFPAEAEYLEKRWANVYADRRTSRADRERYFARLGVAPTDDGGKSGAAAGGGKAGAADGGKDGGKDGGQGIGKPRPAATRQLVGLAFSGGGIRSATFNLGIAQSLHKRGVLDHVDYLSTVSGGGYLGSSISTIMRDGAPFPYQVQEGPRESAYINWLRNHSNYLAERGFIDYVRLFALLLRGIVLNFLIIVPTLLLLALLLDSHFAATVSCPITNQEITSDQARECEGDELGFLNRGILTHWERQVAVREVAEAREHALSGDDDAEAAEDGDENAVVEAKVEKELGRVNYLEAYRLTPLVAAFFIFYYLLYPVVIRVFKVLQHDATGGNESSVKTRDAYELTFAKLAVLVGGVVAIETLPVLLHAFHQLKDIGVVRGVVASVAGGSSVIALTLFGRLMQQFAGLTRKLVMIAVGLLGMLLPLIFVLYVAETLVWEWHALVVSDPEWRTLALFVGLVLGGALASLAAKLTGGTKFADLANGNLRSGFAALVFFVFFAAPFFALAFFTGSDAEGGTHGWMVLKVLLCALLAWAAALLFEWATARSKKLRSAKGGKVRYLLVGVFALAALALCWWQLPTAPPTTQPDSIYYTEMLVHAAEEGEDVAAAGAMPQVVASGDAPTGVNPAWFVFALALTIWFFSWAALDINLTSFHGVYRDRLAEAYLVGIDRDTRLNPKTRLDGLSLRQIDIEDDLDLADVNQRDSKAPYHLVNVAHNLQGSDDPNVRERSSDFFIFSKRYYGGHRTGYAKSEELEGFFPQMDLATAMAISAAAAAPNMGATTNRMLVALMVLLNVRLGYWVPNPRRLKEWMKDRRATHDYYCRHHGEKTYVGPGRCTYEETVDLWLPDGEKVTERRVCDRLLTPKSELHERFRWRIPPRLIFSELASKPEEKKPWINLSDGGHIENLAAYELLRRRCKYIIVGDGGGDPNFTFGSLATLKRYARIDMGVEIEILLDDLRLDDERYSYQHAAVGTIHYPAIDGVVDAETGYLLYIKLSVTGDEDEVVNEYRRRYEAFPHQSTADQFFDEGQFEAYRDLGFHVAEGLFQGDEVCREFRHFGDWIRDLKSNLAPRMAAESLFLELQADLARIEEIIQDDALERYYYQLHPQLAARGVAEPPAPSTDAEKRDTERRLMRVVGAQLRLMENVYVALDLERARNWDNEGNLTWRRLLERWAEAPLFRETFPAAILQHRRDFAAFCRRRLL